MHVDFEIPDGLFRGRKTEREILTELREAAAIYWLARGEIEPGDFDKVAPRPAGSFKDLLLAMPDVGEDADFERDLEAPDDSKEL